MTTGGARAEGVGGGLFGLRDSVSFNTSNPALAAFARRTMIRMGGTVGFWSTTSNGETDADAESIWKDFALYVPVAKRWVSGLCIEPQRKMDLNLFTRKTAYFEGPMGGGYTEQEYEERSKWAGSTIALRLNNAYQINDRFAAGLSLNYLLEHNELTQRLDFDTAGYRDVGYSQILNYRGWSATLGLHGQVTPELGIGLFYTPRSTGRWTIESEKSDDDSTLQAEQDGSYPGELGLGVAYQFRKGWTGLLDARIGQWDAKDLAVRFGRSTSSPETPVWLSAGFERKLIPVITDQKGGLAGFRGGVFYRSHYWAKEGRNPYEHQPAIMTSSFDPVRDVGLTAGASMFVNSGGGLIHGAVEVGQRSGGKIGADTKEAFFRTSIQIEISEKWFQRRNPRGIK
ncbi:hypothetical protein HZB60_06055 [candidate division KSB1 bacterium]|nr:hypothetical protein [candidate division KSB1 bacterium]